MGGSFSPLEEMLSYKYRPNLEGYFVQEIIQKVMKIVSLFKI